MGQPGTYIKVIKGGNPPVSVIVPYSDAFGFTCTQRYFHPLQELFDGAKGIVQEVLDSTGTSGGDIAAGTIEALSQGLRLFGVQLFSKAFLANAWEKEEPLDLGVTLKFFYGMKEVWSGKTEVHDPIMNIMRATVPQQTNSTDIVITAPAPNAIDVYKFFAQSLFANISEKIKEGVEKYIGTLGQNITADQEAGATAIANNTWTISIGYSANGTSIVRPFYTIKNLVVTSSGFTFSTEVDSAGAPINGTLKLSFSSQTLVVSNDFAAF